MSAGLREVIAEEPGGGVRCLFISASQVYEKAAVSIAF